jgi:allantoinase
VVTILRSRRVVLPDGERPATVVVREGRIAAIEPYETPFNSADLGEVALLPGLVDTHVHVNEPGRTEWEGFATATRAAAAGGVTTIVDMPLNSIPPTVDVAALEIKRRAARDRVHVDVGFWGGAVPGNAGELEALHAAGVFGFKAFLIDSGVPEFPPLDIIELAAAMRAVDALFVVHAEDPALVGVPPGGSYADFVASRPPAAEANAVALAAATAHQTGRRAHILHLSAARALSPLAEARRAGARVSVETCPHYLALAAEEVPDDATEFKCCPPIRSAANRDELWRALADGSIDCVVSDHSPCPPDLKAGDFASAWGGIASVQLGLRVVWTEALRRGHSLADVVRWMARAPADLVGLSRKGRIEVGADADLVAFDPDASTLVDASELHHRHPVTPYAGRTLRGSVVRTWLRGEVIDFSTPRGRLLVRPDAS